VGIAALVFSFKIKANYNAIAVNSQIIETNKKHSDQNDEQIIILQTIAIPNAEELVRKEEVAKEKIESSLRQSQQNSNQALKQAKEIEPIPPAGLFFQAIPTQTLPSQNEVNFLLSPAH
jgi:hypothetical protein